MNKVILLILGLYLFSCNQVLLFPSREYRGGGNIFEFYSDNTYRYLVRMEGSYVYKYNYGTWKQEGRNLFLFDSVEDLKELPFSLSSYPSIDNKRVLVVNVLPKNSPNFDYLPQVIDLINVEVIINNRSYKLKNETSVISLQKPADNVSFKMYPKENTGNRSEILIDTLRSANIHLTDKDSVVIVDLDCNPLYFARYKLGNDTLRIINNRNIKWHKINLKN